MNVALEQEKKVTMTRKILAAGFGDIFLHVAGKYF